MQSTCIEVWGDFDLATSKDVVLTADSGKRRRINEIVKTSLFLSEQDAPGHGGLAVMLARGALDEQDHTKLFLHQVALTWASGHLTFSKIPHILSHAGDAARVGKPALDLFFSTCWYTRTGFNLEYAPAVFLCRGGVP